MLRKQRRIIVMPACWHGTWNTNVKYDYILPWSGMSGTACLRILQVLGRHVHGGKGMILKIVSRLVLGKVSQDSNCLPCWIEP